MPRSSPPPHLVLASLVLLAVLVALPGRARASPTRASMEDLFASGDVDAEDVAATRARALPRATVGRAASGPASAPGGSAWVSLLGFAGARDGGPEVGGGLVVGLPLDRLARAGPGTSRSLGPRAAGFAPATAPEPGARGPVERDAATARLARACVSAAWQAAGLGEGDARIDAIVARARWSALLPEARVRALRGEDQRATLDGTDTSRLRGSAGADLALEARLTWRLDRLLFADDEPSFERLRLERHDARLRVAARVLDALFVWQRASAELRAATAAGLPADPEQAFRAAESEATLDVLTGGWFSDRASSRAVREGGPRSEAADASRR